MTRTFAPHAFRAFALGCAVAAAPLSAKATLALTIPTNALQADAIQAFSPDGLDSFDVVGITVMPLGNASAVPGVTGAYNLPVTSITLQLVKIAGGSASGSALAFNRINEDTGAPMRVTLANFSIDFNAKQVLADATRLGQTTAPKTPIFNFREQTPLGLKYQFPLSITGTQILDKLFLTTEGKRLFKTALELPDIADQVLDTTDFGTITVKVVVKPRSRPVPSRPYVVTP